MSEIIVAIISVLGTALGAILIARLSKTRQEKAIDVAGGSLKLVDMTMDQLERKINEIDELHKDVGKLERDNRRLSVELVEFHANRKRRDESFEAIEAKVAALQAQSTQDARDRDELRKKLSELDGRYRALWQYLIAWMEHSIKHGVTPIEPPKELQSDPEIMRILGRKKE
jgi:septal ring factor EnvC (AmiA/AmiB activator)